MTKLNQNSKNQNQNSKNQNLNLIPNFEKHLLFTKFPESYNGDYLPVNTFFENKILEHTPSHFHPFIKNLFQNYYNTPKYTKLFDYISNLDQETLATFNIILINLLYYTKLTNNK